MIAYSPGDVVLVGFVFADESGRKLRPAVVLSVPAYHRARQEVIVAAMTSNMGRPRFGDHVLGEWKGAGLLFPSLVTGIIRTIKRTMIQRKLGSLAKPDLDAVQFQFRRCLAL